MRTKAGHCIQCDTSKIAFQLRSSDSGFVYLAHSESTGYVKIGYSRDDPHARMEKLREQAYGGARDWVMKRVVWLERDAGSHEFAIQYRLSEFQRLVEYEKQLGSIVVCREIFACRLAHAIKVFEQVPI
ncbi:MULTISPECIES: GIY-YIG nuclease family protein [unclassified Caballeronia]|uniref:GIY-YIG nuclease family protein n=1 Tax=unclassified Caballeronia TaxID=2646786 RepID=UPI00211176D2|nr:MULTISPECIES: GIY-YIG nuclease family protein [unclassified Caballeronia]